MRPLLIFFILIASSFQAFASKNITVLRDLNVCAGLDIAYPSHKDSYPMIIFIHGGSWMEGDKNWYSSDIEDFARQGIVAATINYKLYNETNYDFSETVEDIKCALRYFKTSTNTYHIDASQVHLAGDSAGGHLSLLVGLKYKFKIKGLFSYAGPTDLAHMVDTNPKAKGFFEMIMGDNWLIYSPILFVKTYSPPIYVFHGTRDDLVPYEQATRLQQKAQSKKTSFILFPLEGEGHVFRPKTWEFVLSETAQIVKSGATPLRLSH